MVITDNALSLLDLFRNSWISWLQIPAIRLKRSPSRFRLLRYTPLRIRKRLRNPMTFSTPTRTAERSRLCLFASGECLAPLGFLSGRIEYGAIRECPYNRYRHTKPLIPRCEFPTPGTTENRGRSPVRKPYTTLFRCPNR